MDTPKPKPQKPRQLPPQEKTLKEGSSIQKGAWPSPVVDKTVEATKPPAKKLPYVAKPHLTQSPFRDNESMRDLHQIMQLAAKTSKVQEKKR